MPSFDQEHYFTTLRGLILVAFETCACTGEDLCCAFWCAPCSICQMMRHEGMAGKSYSVISPEGTVAV